MVNHLKGCSLDSTSESTLQSTDEEDQQGLKASGTGIVVGDCSMP